MQEVDVLIVGAGPVGTVAAYGLAEQGVRVMLCEAGDTCAQDLRASTFHPPTLSMLDELGIADEIIEHGLKAPKYHFRERRTGEVVEFDVSELADELQFPFRIQCEQHIMAGIVADRLAAHPNADVRFNHRALHFQQNEDGVVASFETPMDIQQVRARYLIAADGGSSTIRKWLGVEFEGFTYPEKFLCLSTKVELGDSIDGLAYVNYVADPEEWLVLLRVPRVWRILVPASEEEADSALLSDDKKNQVFEGLIGIKDVPTEHRTIYRVHQRVAKKFHHGRVFLVGDAAHLNNPLGGFGMNSGIHDAVNLQEKLLQCLRSGHDEALFDQFDRQRRTVTHNFIQAQTMQNKALLEHGAAAGHAKRLAEMRDTQADPVKRKAFLRRQSMVTSLQDAAAIE